MDVEWRKKLVEAAMDLGSRKNWGAYTGIFIALMLVIATIPHDEDYHDFADQRTLFLGIPNTLNVVSVIPFFFIGLAGLILNHCESYFRLCSQRALYTLFFAALLVSVLLVLVHSFTISTRKMTPYFGTHCQILCSCKSRRGCRQTNLYMDSSYCQWPYSWSFMCCNGTSFFHSHVSEKDKANSTRKTHDSSAASIKAYFHGLLIGAQDDLPMGAQVTGISAIPLEMKKLSNLKYLCLRDNPKLVDLPKGLIGKFEKLKELDIFATGCLLNSFLVRELQEADLGYLMLGLTVKAGASLMLLSKQPRISASAIYICLRDLNGYTIYLDMLSDCKKLRELEIVDCGVTSLVVQNINETQHTWQRLPSLQLVTIRRLPSLEEVDFHTMGVNITSLSICDCPMVIDLTWIKGLINLEQLSVSDCNMVKKILSLDVANQETISLPKLKTIHLERLRELLVISDVTLKLESIVHVSVFLCGKLVGLLPVDKDKPKVLLDCDKIFSQTVMQDGNRSSYIMRVA